MATRLRLGPAIFLALAVILSGCVRLPEPDPEPWPLDRDAQMEPDGMSVAPAGARPGEVVAVTYRDAWDRGSLYAIDRGTDGGWMRLHLMISDADGGEPTWFSAGDEDVAVAAVGVAGAGPDRIRIPEVIVPGDYRICTANAVENVCTPIEVVGP